MLWFLLGTSGLFMMVGEWTEAVILLIALIPFLGMDFYLHRHTQASAAGLSHSLAVRATVLRDGKQHDIAATELVPGDLVLVHTGESYPADGVIEVAETLLCDELLLTGEAYPVHKQAFAVLLRDEISVHVASDAWLFAGTRIIKGQARLRILYTRTETVYGESCTPPCFVHTHVHRCRLRWVIWLQCYWRKRPHSRHFCIFPHCIGTTGYWLWQVASLRLC